MLTLNMWFRSEDGKPIKVRVLDGVPTHEVDEEGRAFRLTAKETKHYTNQFSGKTSRTKGATK